MAIADLDRAYAIRGRPGFPRELPDGALVARAQDRKSPMKKQIIILGSRCRRRRSYCGAPAGFPAGEVKQNIERWPGRWRHRRRNVTCETSRVGGFPFRFDADCHNGRASSMAILVVDVPGIRASVRVYRPPICWPRPGAAALDRHLHRHAQRRQPDRPSRPAPGSTTGASPASRFRARTSYGPIRWSAKAVIAQSPLAEIHLLDIPEQHDAENATGGACRLCAAQNLAYPGMTITDTNAEVQLELNGLPDDVRNWG